MPTEHQPLCELCDQPMPEGEEMFRYHGYSGPCPEQERTIHRVDNYAGHENPDAGVNPYA